MNKSEIMLECIKHAALNMVEGAGGPFGAAVVKDGEIISIASNTVLRDWDPTAHAEINAIRQACAKLGTYDLSGYTLYATGYPCPMCMSAAMWANIKNIVVGANIKEAEEIGFRDDFMYEFLAEGCSDSTVVNIDFLNDSRVRTLLYDDYVKLNGTVY